MKRANSIDDFNHQVDFTTPDMSPFDDKGIQWAWNSSSIGLVETCLRKYYLRVICGWTPGGMQVHLWFGSHYATGLERYHKLIADEVPREEAIRTIVHQALIDTWDHETDKSGNPIPGTGKPVDSLHNAKTRENLVRSLVWYCEEFKKDPCKIITLGSGKAAAEFSSVLHIDDTITFCAHMDQLVEFGGEQYVMDQKTTKYTLTPKYFDGFNPGTQMSMYTFMGQAILSSPIKGVIIDAAQIAVGFTRFVRGFTFRTAGELTEWFDDAMHWIERGREATRENFFPKNTTACGNYGGCEFRHICGRDPQHRDKFLRADFIKKPMLNPLEKR